MQCVLKKEGIMMVYNKRNELLTLRLVTDWQVCMDYMKLNSWTLMGHFPIPFMDQSTWMVLVYDRIFIAHKDQEKTIFTCPIGYAILL